MSSLYHIDMSEWHFEQVIGAFGASVLRSVLLHHVHFTPRLSLGFDIPTELPSAAVRSGATALGPAVLAAGTPATEPFGMPSGSATLSDILVDA